MTKNNSGPGNKKKIEKKPLPSTHPHSFKSFLTSTPKPSSPLTRQTGKAKARINKVHMFPIQIGDIVIVAAYSWYIHTKLQVEASPPQASCLATWAQDEKNQKDVQNLHLLGSYVRLATDGGPMASNPQYQNRADCLFPFYIYMLNVDETSAKKLEDDKDLFFSHHPILQAFTDAARISPINKEWVPGIFTYNNNTESPISNATTLTDILMEGDIFDLFHTVTNMTKNEVIEHSENEEFREMICLFFNYETYYEEAFFNGLKSFYPF